MTRRELTDDVVMAYHGRATPLAGLEFKQSLPVIKDGDLDWDKHVREFHSIMDCYAVQRKNGVNPFDMLTIFQRTLPVGSTRRLIYETAIEKARNAHRLPHDARAVYDEILRKIGGSFRESELQKRTRVEAEFDNLSMEIGRAHV